MFYKILIVCVYATAHMNKSEDNLRELALPFPYMGPAH